MVHQKDLRVLLPEEVVEVRRAQPQALREKLQQMLAKLGLLRHILLLCLSVAMAIDDSHSETVQP
jgi:hypothetical protein